MLTLVLLLVLMAVVFVAARMGFVEIPFLSATPGDEPAPSEPVSFAGSGPEATAPDETQVARAASAAAAPSATAPPRPTGTDTSAVSGGDTGAADGGAADEGAPAPGTPGDPATPPVAGAGLQYSVAVSAWRRMDAAMGQVRAWERRRPDLVFVAAPVEVRGILYFRVLAGPASTVPEGEALRSRLAAEMSEPGADDWMVRRTHLAFALGDHPTLEAARGHASRLQRDGIPAYVLRIPGDGVTVSFRVYAGAYRNEAEAETLRRLLVERNVEHSPLTDRTGDIPG